MVEPENLLVYTSDEEYLEMLERDSYFIELEEPKEASEL